MIDENDWQEDKNKSEICNICHALLSGKKYGVYAYITKDNLIEYCCQK